MIEPDIRPKAFAALELLLDFTYAFQNLTGSDLESTIIFACVAEATMRPVVLDPEISAQMLRVVQPPEEVRGSISRLLIADRTGLPRETVRRKVKALVKAGVLIEDENGAVRSPRSLGDPGVQSAIRETYEAVRRYESRLRQFGAWSETSTQNG